VATQERKVGALTITLPSDREFAMSRVFDAPRSLVWEALTKPEHIVRWFGSRQDKPSVCEVDLRVGGKARCVWSLGDGSEMGITWTFREIEPPIRAIFTEVFDEPYREEMGVETLNTLTLDEEDGKTAVTLSTLYRSQEDRDRAMATGMEEGAAESFDLLAELLETLQR
jgi:uncharacterized protein YndB with AHSA1/START domain